MIDYSKEMMEEWYRDKKIPVDTKEPTPGLTKNQKNYDHNVRYMKERD